MNPRQRSAWTRIRAKGRGRYIWKYGMLYWGLSMGIAAALISQFVGNDFSFENLFNPDLYWEMVARGLVFTFLFGPLFGWYMWNSNERKYEQTNR